MIATSQQRIDDLIRRLNAISEELADLAIDVIQSAISAGETRRPAKERSITRARTAVGKAVHELGERVEMIDEMP